VPARGGVARDQRLDRMQALALATRRCDWFMSLDGRIGRLEVGRLADLVVLRDDYFQVPVDEIRTLTSVLTMVGGRVVYGADVFAGLDGARG
jgi:predicted amidohydrolase YtcJ